MYQRNLLQPSIRALFLLLLCSLVVGEIGKDFSHCPNFFYNKTPPQGVSAPGYQPICQRYRNQYHFASLYDRQRRVPLFSAYRLSPADGKRPKSVWMYEPQVRRGRHLFNSVVFIVFFFRWKIEIIRKKHVWKTQSHICFLLWTHEERDICIFKWRHV